MMTLLRSIGRWFVRTFAFLHKEIVEILRQPRLVLTLIIGPFLILLLFGIGYRNEARPLRTLFVVPPGSEMETQVQEYAQRFGPPLIFAGLLGDSGEALNRLRRGEVDMVVLTPSDAYQKIRNNEQAVFTLYHNELDPFQVSYVEYFGRVYVDEVNRLILEDVAGRGQVEASTLQETVQAMRASTQRSREALERADAAAARADQRDMDRSLSAIEAAVGGTLGLLNSMEQTSGATQDTSTLRELLAELRQETDNLGKVETGRDDYAPEVERLRRMETRLDELNTQLTDFRQISPTVLVRPFRSETSSVAQIQPRLSDYFAPSVIVLLLQHLALTFAALSIVRERQLGAIELFRVSPLSAFEALLGKYVSYMLFGGVLATVLTLLVVYVLRVPMLGDWRAYAALVAGLLFTSLGLGFVISLLSTTDSQAVQYSMIVLLTSVFFTGLFVSLQSFWEPVRAVSWLLPATYGISMLQDIMLRGLMPSVLLSAALAAFGLLLFAIALLLLHRRMARYT